MLSLLLSLICASQANDITKIKGTDQKLFQPGNEEFVFRSTLEKVAIVASWDGIAVFTARPVLLLLWSLGIGTLGFLWISWKFFVPVAPEKHSVATQSQTTYTAVRGALNPRFQPLPEYR